MWMHSRNAQCLLRLPGRCVNSSDLDANLHARAPATSLACCSHDPEPCRPRRRSCAGASAGQWSGGARQHRTADGHGDPVAGGPARCAALGALRQLAGRRACRGDGHRFWPDRPCAYGRRNQRWRCRHGVFSGRGCCAGTEPGSPQGAAGPHGYGARACACTCGSVCCGDYSGGGIRSRRIRATAKCSNSAACITSRASTADCGAGRGSRGAGPARAVAGGIAGTLSRSVACGRLASDVARRSACGGNRSQRAAARHARTRSER